MGSALRRMFVPLWPGLLLAAPGCMTSELWAEEDPVERVVLCERAIDAAIAVEMDPTVEGALRVDVRRADDLAVPVASGMVDRASIWRLRPGPGADVAAALLDGSAAFEVDSVEVLALREVAGGLVTESEAELRIHGRVLGSGLALPVDSEALPPGLLASLHTFEATDVLPDYCMPLAVPELMAQCTSRLRTAAIGAWLPGAGTGHRRVAGYVWIERDRLEAVDGARARKLVGSFGYSDRSLARRLEALRMMRLLVAVAGRERTEFFVLRPDLLWLCGALDACDGFGTHSSRWWAEPVATAPGTASADALARGTMHLDYVVARYDELVAQNVVRKIVLTPFTVGADVAMGVVYALIEHPVGLLRALRRPSQDDGR